MATPPSPPIPPSLALLGFFPNTTYKQRLKEYAAIVGWCAPKYVNSPRSAVKGKIIIKSTVLVNNVRYETPCYFRQIKSANECAANLALTELISSALPERPLGWCQDRLLQYARKMNYAEPTFAYKTDKADNPGQTQVTCIVEVGGIWYIGDTKNTRINATEAAVRSALRAIEFSPNEVVEKPNEETMEAISPCKRQEPEPVTGNVDAVNNEVETGTVSFEDPFTNAVQVVNVDAVNTELVPGAIKIPSADNNLGPEVKLNIDALNTELGSEAIKIPVLNSSLHNEVMTVQSANPNESPDVKTGTVSFGDSSPQAVKVKKTTRSKKRCLDGKNVVQARYEDAVNTELDPESTRIPSADNKLGPEVKVNIDAVNTELVTEAIKISSVNSSLDKEVMTVLSANPNEGPDVKTGTASSGDSSPQVVKVKKTTRSRKRFLDGQNVVQARNVDAVNTELGPEATMILTADNNLVPEVMVNIDAVNTELGTEAIKIPSVNSSLDNEVMTEHSANPDEGPDVKRLKTGTVSFGDSSPQVIKVKKTRIKKSCLAGNNAVQAKNVDAVNTELGPEAIKIPSADNNLGPEVKVNIDAVNTELATEAMKIPSENSSLDNEVMTVLSVNPNEGPDVKTGIVSVGDSSPQVSKVKKTRSKTLAGKNEVQARNVDAVNTEAIKIPSVISSLDNEVMTVLSSNPNEGPDVKTYIVSFGDSSPQVLKVKKTRKSKTPCLAGKNAVKARNIDAVNTEAIKIPTSDNNLSPGGNVEC